MIREEERIKIQFPSGVNVILVMPPVYNETRKGERDIDTDTHRGERER